MVIKESCIDSLEVIDGYGNSTHPAQYKRSSGIRITAGVDLNQECVDPMTSSFTWRILTSTEDGNIAMAFQKTTQVSVRLWIWQISVRLLWDLCPAASGQSCLLSFCYVFFILGKLFILMTLFVPVQNYLKDINKLVALCLPGACKLPIHYQILPNKCNPNQ